MKNRIALIIVLFSWQLGLAQDETRGVRGDPAAIADAEAMVETMGGMEIWSHLKSVHFVHEWYPWYREAYVENEILGELADIVPLQVTEPAKFFPEADDCDA